MPVDKLFGGSLALSAKALDVISDRQGLIQSNLANLETPGYRAQDIPFAKVMQQVMTGQGELLRTNEKHMNGMPAGEAVGKNEIIRGGKVDLDEQMLKLSQNQLLYQVNTKIVTQKFDGLRYAIDEGGK